MYYQFFGLAKNPFSMTPDPSSLYLTDAHREAIAGLSYGAFSRKGFVVLTGEAGTGKTTLLRRLVELSKESNARCSVVFNPLLSPAEFLELLLFNFGLRDMPASKTQRLLKLEELLLETHRTRKTAVLIVDEAHKLSHDVFEEIRLLTNFETGDDKLLQIVLAGQPELKGVLNHPELWQLKQRIAVRVNIDPLAARQVGNFIAFRWARFGGAEPHPFTKEAVSSIAQWSRGIPRLVNSICDNALLVAYSQQCRRVGANEILEVARDLDLPAPLDEINTGDMEAGEPVMAPMAISELRPKVPETNGNGHGNGIGNGHKLTYPANGHSVDAASTIETEPAPGPPAKTELPADSERVRAQAATRARPSVFQRAERSSSKAPLVSPATPAAVPAPAAANTLRETVRVQRLLRHDVKPAKVSRLKGWLAQLGVLTIHANGKQTNYFQRLWRKK